MEQTTFTTIEEQEWMAICLRNREAMKSKGAKKTIRLKKCNGESTSRHSGAQRLKAKTEHAPMNACRKNNKIRHAIAMRHRHWNANLQIDRLKASDNPGNGDKPKRKPRFAKEEACSLTMKGILQRILPGPEIPAATHNGLCNFKRVSLAPEIKHLAKLPAVIVVFGKETRL